VVAIIFVLNKIMKEEICFLGFRFNSIQFFIFLLGWTFFLCFIWPLTIGSYFGISVFVCVFSVAIVAYINSKMILLLFVLFQINKKIVIYFQYFVLVLCSFLGTLVFSFFEHFGIYIFLCHLFINTFTVYLYYKFIILAQKND
jgi:hypothetical protein